MPFAITARTQPGLSVKEFLALWLHINTHHSTEVIQTNINMFGTNLYWLNLHHKACSRACRVLGYRWPHSATLPTWRSAAGDVPPSHPLLAQRQNTKSINVNMKILEIYFNKWTSKKNCLPRLCPAVTYICQSSARHRKNMIP